jgi:hypothetical protein
MKGHPMGIINNLWQSVVENLNGTASRHTDFHRHLEALSDQLGWSIDESKHDSVGFYFHGGKLRRLRTVTIKDMGHGFVCLYCCCNVSLSLEMARAVSYGMLKANLNLLFMKYVALPLDDGGVGFALYYQCPLEALTPGLLKYLGEKMTATAADFDELCIDEGVAS